MAKKITVSATPVGRSTKMSGFVGDYEVISLSNGIAGEWRITSSACLPGALDEAAAYMECLKRAFSCAREHGAPVPIV